MALPWEFDAMPPSPRTGKRSVFPTRSTLDVACAASCVGNIESVTEYRGSGKRRIEPKYTLTAPGSSKEGRLKGCYTITSWEGTGRRFVRPESKPEKEIRRPKSTSLKAPPFALDAGLESSSKVHVFNQKRRVAEPTRDLRDDADLAERRKMQLLQRHANTPTKNSAASQRHEGFCVLYSTRPNTGALVQEMQMAGTKGYGKHKRNFENEVVHQRGVDENRQRLTLAKRSRYLADHIYDSDRRTHSVGKNRAHTPPSRSVNVSSCAPFAINLPVKNDDVGISTPRARAIRARTPTRFE